MKTWIGLIAGIICGILLYFGLDAKMQEQHAIAIIGGTDGPTSVFIAGKIGTGDIFLALTAVVAVIVWIVWLVGRKKNKE